MKAGGGTFQRRWHARFTRLPSVKITNSRKGRWPSWRRTARGSFSRPCPYGEYDAYRTSQPECAAQLHHRLADGSGYEHCPRAVRISMEIDLRRAIASAE